MKFGNITIGGMSFGSTKIGGAKFGNTLVFSPGGSEPALPYTPVEYIETDGVAYINTRIAGTPPMSSEIKVMMGSDTGCGILSAWTLSSGSNSRNFALLKYLQKRVIFSYYYTYGASLGTPLVEYSVDNGKPFIVKTSLKYGAQSISVKEENTDSWVSASNTLKNTVSSTYGLVLFNGYQGGSYSIPAPAGTRIYYCKIYNDEAFTSLIRDYVPCFYNGTYGLWDRVSESFFGSANSGIITGPSIQ